MKRHIRFLTTLAVVACVGLANGATFTVTTTNSSGAGSLSNAVASLATGDSISFNIPGTGPFYMDLPAGGLPIIRVDNVTIDGYTQPGSVKNTSTILGSNNAVIQIVLKGTDTRVGTTNEDGSCCNITGGSVKGFIDLTAAGLAGFTDQEEALLAFDGPSGISVSGLCFLGDWANLPKPNDDPPGQGPAQSQYGIALGGNLTSDSCHIWGCRFGLAPDNVTVGRFKDGVAWFGAGASSLTIGVAAGPADTATARAQFNIFIGCYIPLIGDSYGPIRICGNFFNVYPDGLHDYTVNTDDGSLDHSMEAPFESSSHNLNSYLIGTDGDGLNDAEERNVFGGVTESGDRRILEWYGSTQGSVVVAGNYFGMGVDGLTRFTNGGPNMQLFESFKNGSTVQFGSDFNGVSDALEGNVISWNYPFATLFPNPAVPNFSNKFRFGNIDVGCVMALRGNSFVGMQTPPITYFGRPADDAGRLAQYTNHVNVFMTPAGDYNTFRPALSASSSSTALIGTCAPGLAPYDVALIVDVYKADGEGWANGMKLPIAPLIVTNGATIMTNGFASGKTYLKSLVDNGPFDSNPAVGSFNFNVGPSGANLGLTANDFVTVTANYSDTAPGPAGGATGALVHTSNFATPIGLGPIKVNSIVNNGGGTATISWTGPQPVYSLQSTPSLTSPVWTTIASGLSGPSTTAPITGAPGYFRISSP